MTQVLHLSSPWNKFLVSLFISIQPCFHLWQNFTLSFSDVFISPRAAYCFRCWFFNNSVQALFVRMFSFKFICGKNYHFLLHNLIPMIYLWFLRPEALWCFSFLSSYRILRIMFFRTYPFNRSACPLSKFLFNSFSFQSECCPKSFLPIVPFFQ